MKTNCLSVSLALCVLVAMGAGCKKRSTIEQTQTLADVNSAVLKTREADALYAQRENLSKVRQGLTLLRQAQLEDSGSYDVTWRLAKFDYYLGAHTTDADEGYKAFQEGIEAGKKAVSLQPNKAEGHFRLGANHGGRATARALA